MDNEPPARGTLINAVAGAKVSGDGRYMLLKLKLSSAKESVVAIPINEAARLIDLVAYALTKSAELREQPRSKRRAFRALSCTVGWEALGDHVVLTMKLPGGGNLSFLMDRGLAAGTQRGLADLLGRRGKHAGVKH